MANIAHRDIADTQMIIIKSEINEKLTEEPWLLNNADVHIDSAHQRLRKILKTHSK